MSLSSRSPRTLPLAALVAVVVVVTALVVATRGGPTYTLHAVFANVNGLVKSGSVEVAETFNAV